MYIKSWKTWLFISYLILVIYFSFQPNDNLRWFSQLWKYDKIVHFFEYFGVGFLLINALKIKPLSKTYWIYAVWFLCIFPISDELLQYYTPRRIPDIYDVFADIVGGLIGAYIRRYY
tara:strand:+ start:111 stop:461 length:351 start_codon:yes stop_codon:yes gene_type:complete